MDERDELLVTERVGLIAWHLAQGGTVTVREVATRYGVTHNGAWRILSKLGRCLPLVNDEQGHWYAMHDR
jgi:hypothetical protein